MRGRLSAIPGLQRSTSLVLRCARDDRDKPDNDD
jgi:hypothetical protein